MAGSIFEPHPPKFGNSDIFLRSTNDISTTFENFNYYKSCKKCTQAILPGVEESMIKPSSRVKAMASPQLWVSQCSSVPFSQNHTKLLWAYNPGRYYWASHLTLYIGIDPT